MLNSCGFGKGNNISLTPIRARPIPTFPAIAVAPPKNPTPVKLPPAKVAPPDKTPTPIKAAPNNNFLAPPPAPVMTGTILISV